MLRHTSLYINILTLVQLFPENKSLEMELVGQTFIWMMKYFWHIEKEQLVNIVNSWFPPPGITNKQTKRQITVSWVAFLNAWVPPDPQESPLGSPPPPLSHSCTFVHIYMYLHTTLVFCVLKLSASTMQTSATSSICCGLSSLLYGVPVIFFLCSMVSPVWICHDPWIHSSRGHLSRFQFFRGSSFPPL